MKTRTLPWTPRTQPWEIWIWAFWYFSLRIVVREVNILVFFNEFNLLLKSAHHNNVTCTNIIAPEAINGNNYNQMYPVELDQSLTTMWRYLTPCFMQNCFQSMTFVGFQAWTAFVRSWKYTSRDIDLGERPADQRALFCSITFLQSAFDHGLLFLTLRLHV